MICVIYSLGKYVQRLRGGDETIQTFPCPTCRSEFTLKLNQDVADLTSVHFIENMLEIMAFQEKAKVSAKCSRCQDPAINHCATCHMFMCEKCSEWHDSWPTHKNDIVLSVEKLTNPENQMKMKKKHICKKHNDKILEYYCKRCRELCCIDCVLFMHSRRYHCCVPLRQLAQIQREKLQYSCTKLDEKLSEGNRVLKNICEVMKSLEKNAKTAKDEIKKQKENILKVVAEKLDEKEKKINEKVDKIYGEMHLELSKQHDEIEKYLDKVHASLSFPRNLLKRGSVEEILPSQNLVDERIERLENERPLKLYAVNDGEIQFLPDDIDNINVEEIVGEFGDVKGIFHFYMFDRSQLHYTKTFDGCVQWMLVFLWPDVFFYRVKSILI